METLFDHAPFRVSSETTVMDATEEELQTLLKEYSDLKDEVHNNIISNPKNLPEDGRLEMMKTIQLCMVGSRALQQAAIMRGFAGDVEAEATLIS